MGNAFNFIKSSGSSLHFKLISPLLCLLATLGIHYILKLNGVLPVNIEYVFLSLELLIAIMLCYVGIYHVKKPLSFLINSPELRDYSSEEKIDEMKGIELIIQELLIEKNIATEFTRKIEEGKYDSEMQSERKGGLFSALILLQKKLQNVAEEDRKRNWASDGLAHFVEILRSYNNNLEKLGEQVIAALVKTLKANQGGLFYLNNDSEEKPYLELLACYAFDRKKYISKKVEIGEGLVGQAVLEKETIYISEIPEGYLSITSGLGHASPKYLLVVPMKINEEVEGVVELASFKAFEPYEISFVEKLSESIASNISSMRVHDKNKALLEDSITQSELLRQQEEEVRQNLEELTATQEEMSRKNKEMEGLLADYVKKEDELNKRMKEIEANKKEIKSLTKISESSTILMNLIDLVPYPIFVKDEKQEYVMVNDAQAKLFSIDKNELVGKTDADLVNDVEELNIINDTDRKVLKDKTAIELPEQEITHHDGSRKILVTHKIPFISDIDGSVNILGVSIDNTYKRIAEKNLVG